MVEYFDLHVETSEDVDVTEEIYFDDSEIDVIVRQALYLSTHGTRHCLYQTTGSTKQHRSQLGKRSLAAHRQYLACGNINQKVKADDINSSFLHGLDWQPTIDMMKTKSGQQTLLSMLKSYDYLNRTIETWNPMVLGAKVNGEDNPNWNQAMNGPNAQGFWEACIKEMQTLEKMGVWDVVDRQPWMNILPTTWAFKSKDTLQEPYVR